MRQASPGVRKRLPLLSVLAAIASAVCLVLPWIRMGARDRSSIDLIGSAGALDIIEGTTKVVVVLLWFALPLLVAGAVLALAAQRRRLMAGLLLPLGPILGLIVGVLVRALPEAVVWGAWLSAGFAVAASALALAVILTS